MGCGGLAGILSVWNAAFFAVVFFSFISIFQMFKCFLNIKILISICHLPYRENGC